jgi:tetratricopeptide (TPR) repeat protein
MSNKVSDNLHRLIRSLSKPEKRYFKLYASRHTSGEENNYIKLFDAIEKQEEYNEQAILEKFKKEAFTNKFSITKGRLYDYVLRSLDAFHSNSSVEAQMERDLHCAEILYKKTLYDQCAKLLASVKKSAVRYEKHTVLLKIFDWEKKLVEKDNYCGKTDEDIHEMLRQDELMAEKIKNFNDFWSLKSRFFMLLNKGGKVRSQEELTNFKKILDNRLLKSESNAMSCKTKYLYHHIYSAYYFGVGDYEKSYEHLKKNLALIEENTDIFREEPNIYFSVITNAIYIGSQLKDYEEVFANLEKLRAVPETFDTSRNEDIEVKMFSSANSIELNLYMHLGEFEKAISLVPIIEEGLKKYEGKLNKVRRADFYFNIAAAYFSVEEYSLSLKWINRLLNDTEIDQSQDIHSFTQMLNLIVHIEMKHDDLVPYTFRSAHRYLSTRNRVYRFETAFLEFIAKILKTSQRSEQTVHYKELLEKMKELQNDPLEKTAFEYFDFISWAESKIARVPFRKVVEEKVRVLK